MHLHSLILGEGTPLIILHGFLGMSDNWKTLGNKFAEAGFQVHLVDQRNHGRSFHAEAFNYDLLAKDLEAYMAHHQIFKAHILGHSMGGKTAMYFATKKPEQVHKLIVVDISPREYPPHHQDILKALTTLNFDAISTRQEAEDVLAQFIPEWGVRQFLLKNVYRVTPSRFGLRINLKALVDNYNEIGVALDKNAQFKGETLFISGANSDYISPTDFPLMQHHFPNYMNAQVAGAGHWVHAENPKSFYEIVINFL